MTMKSKILIATLALAAYATGATAQLEPARIAPAEMQWVKTPNGAERHFEITKLVTIHD